MDDLSHRDGLLQKRNGFFADHSIDLAAQRFVVVVLGVKPPTSDTALVDDPVEIASAGSPADAPIQRGGPHRRWTNNPDVLGEAGNDDAPVDGEPNQLLARSFGCTSVLGLTLDFDNGINLLEPPNPASTGRNAKAEFLE